MSAQRSLFLWELLDLSIGTPRRGAVDFCALRALLHAVLRHLGLRDVTTRWTEAALGVTGFESEEEVPPGTELEERTTPASDPGTAPGNAGKEGEELRSGIQSCEAGVSEAMRLIQELHQQTDDLKEEVKELRLQQKAELTGRLQTEAELRERLQAEADLRERLQAEAELGRDSVTWTQLQRVLLDQELENPDSTRDPGTAASDPRRRQETAEALRSSVGLGAELRGLETELRGLGAELRGLAGRVAATEEGKAERSELAPLTRALHNTDVQDQAKNLTDQLDLHRTLIGRLSGEQEKSAELLKEVQKVLVQVQVDCDLLQRRSGGGASDADPTRADADPLTEQLSSRLQQLLLKVTDQEHNWNQELQRLHAQMELKLNRTELDSLKKQLEDRWSNVQEKLQAEEEQEQEQDAAALRKRLVHRFHCLSCDRPIAKHTPGPYLVTLPSSPAFPSHKSIRPLTVYALEQVRQTCRGSERLAELQDYSQGGVARGCGGGHTLTSANQRRAHSVKHCSQPDAHTGSQSEEVDIVGLDGHIYRGRLNGSAHKLPVLSAKDDLRRRTGTRPAASPDVGSPCSRSASSNSARDWPPGCSSQSSVAPPPGPADGARADL